MILKRYTGGFEFIFESFRLQLGYYEATVSDEFSAFGYYEATVCDEFEKSTNL